MRSDGHLSDSDTDLDENGFPIVEDPAIMGDGDLTFDGEPGPSTDYGIFSMRNAVKRRSSEVFLFSLYVLVSHFYVLCFPLYNNRINVYIIYIYTHTYVQSSLRFNFLFAPYLLTSQFYLCLFVVPPSLPGTQMVLGGKGFLFIFPPCRQSPKW